MNWFENETVQNDLKTIRTSTIEFNKISDGELYDLYSNYSESTMSAAWLHLTLIRMLDFIDWSTRSPLDKIIMKREVKDG